MMSRVRILAVAAVVALGYAAANAVDAALGDLLQLARMINGAANILIDIPAGIAFLVMSLGGLPLAAFALIGELQLASLPVEQRRYPRMPYWCLPFQIVSCGLSAFFLFLFAREFLLYEHTGPPDAAFILAVYLSLQLIMGIAAVPVCRRFVMIPIPDRILRVALRCGFKQVHQAE